MLASRNRATATQIRPVVPLPFIEYVDITPEHAQDLLNANEGNRTIRSRRVHQYAADMAAGRWTASHDMICVDPDGRLLNGQHRLNAVVQSGCTVRFAVQWNTPENAMPNMDTGAARSAGDALRWEGETNAQLAASVCKLALLWTTGRIYRDNRVQAVSHMEIVDFLSGNPDIRHSVSYVNARKARLDINPTPMAVAHWGIMRANDADTADLFTERLASLVGERKGSPVLALYSRLRQIRRQRLDATNRELLALVLKAWNKDAKGEQVASLALTQRGTFSIPTPLSIYPSA